MAKVWVYVLDTDGITVEDFNGKTVATPLLHHLYQADSTNPDIGTGINDKLYSTGGFLNAQELQDAIDAYTPAVVVATKPAVDPAAPPATPNKRKRSPKNAEYDTKDTSTKG